jgi:TolB-like protein/tetratricopeptide (TPR) repeat protein
MKYSASSKKLIAESIQSLVVLPFDNYTGSDSLEYFVSGMHDALIGDIGKISALRVPGTTTSRFYKNVDKSVPEITAELGVDAAIEGSVTCYTGDSICLQIKLVSAIPNEQQIWVQNYYEDKSKILNLYNQVTKQISEEIHIALTPKEQDLFDEYKTVNPEAYDAYLKGKFYWDRLSKESLQKAEYYFKMAIEKDPNWAPPYAGLAQVWGGRKQMAFVSTDEADPHIYKYINKALYLDPNSANSHYVNAMIAVWTEWDWEKGEREFLKVLEINPNDAKCRIYYAHLLMILKRTDESLHQAKLALQIDSQSSLVLGLYAIIIDWNGQHETALEYAKKAIVLDPENRFAYIPVANANYHLKEYDKWFEFWKRGVWGARSFLTDKEIESVEKIFKEKGHLAAIEEIIKFNEEIRVNGRTISNIGQAYRYLRIKKYDKALEYFYKSYENHNPNMPYISLITKKNPELKNHPKYIELLRKMNLQN